MKVRIIHTKFWTDPYIRSLSIKGKLLYLYVFTNEFVNILHLYEIPEDIIIKETGLTEEEIKEIKLKLQKDIKIDFFEEYILLKNAFKYQYYSGFLNNYSKMRLIYEMSESALRYFKDFIKQEMDQIIKEVPKHPNKNYQSLLERVCSRLNIPLLAYPYADTTKKLETRKQKPKSKKEIIEFGVDFSPEVAKVIDHYKKIYKLFYIKKLVENSTAAHHLIENYGVEKVLLMIEKAKETRKQRYYPVISNLMDLLEKWERLDIMLSRDEKEKPKEEDLKIKTSIGKAIKNEKS